MSHNRIYRCSFTFKSARMLARKHTPGGRQHAQKHTRRTKLILCHTDARVPLTYGSLLQYLCLRSSHFGLFCNFKDRFPSDHGNHYITSTLLTDEMVGVRGKNVIEKIKQISAGVLNINCYIYCAERQSVTRGNQTQVVPI